MLVGYAERMPHFRETKDQLTDSESEVRRTSFQRLVSLCWRNPSIVGAAECKVQSLALAAKVAHNKATHFKKISSLANVGEDWAPAFLQASCPGLTVVTLELASDTDPDWVVQIL